MAPSGFSLCLLLLFSSTLPRPALPNRQDLKIKTRYLDGISTRIETLYIKGARERYEIVEDAPIKSSYVSISQCDQKRRIDLKEDLKLYAEFPIVDLSHPSKAGRLPPQPQPAGADVTITFDSVDTGESRQVGQYRARHVKSSMRIDVAPGAIMHAMREERDGWYIELAGLRCQALSGLGGFSFLSPGTSDPRRQDRLHMKRLGTAPRGFPIEETTIRTDGDQTTIGKIELLEFADSPLDPALFERPSGYAMARRTPHGGYDMTQPDTLTNRMQVYWTELTGPLRGLFGNR